MRLIAFTLVDGMQSPAREGEDQGALFARVFAAFFAAAERKVAMRLEALFFAWKTTRISTPRCGLPSSGYW